MIIFNFKNYKWDICAYIPQTHKQQIYRTLIYAKWTLSLCASEWKDYGKQTNMCNYEALNNKESGGAEC